MKQNNTYKQQFIMSKTTFYYSIASKNKFKEWSEEKQYSAKCKTWAEFMTFTNLLAESQNLFLRCSTSPGTNNQGFYINALKD